ncbi:MAG: peptidoglycan-binding protein [bacterium]
MRTVVARLRRQSVLASIFLTLTLNTGFAVAESVAISENLSLDVQVDLLMTELAQYLKVDDNQGIVDLVPRIRALDIEIPNSLYFLEARALYRTGRALAARDRLLAYLANTGREGRYYDQATELLLSVRKEAEIQEDRRREQDRIKAEELARSAQKARGLRLREAQYYLQQIGFRLATVNGPSDKPTREALAVYQVRRSLTVNGDVTDETLELLKTEVPDTDNCDALAAYARLPGQWAVPLEQIAHVAAVPACNDALRRYPDVIRFQVQYARSLLAAGRYDDALGAAKPASHLGYPEADTLIGQMHEMGGFSKAGKPDYFEALRWYKVAAEKEYPEAILSLGRFLEQGQGGYKRSTTAALNRYLQAAYKNYPPAQVTLGSRYSSGTGVSRNYARALELFNSAAIAGYPDGQYRLGEMYERGRGLKRDKTAAIGWYRKASDQGHVGAKQKLSRLGGR